MIQSKKRSAVRDQYYLRLLRQAQALLTAPGSGTNPTPTVSPDALAWEGPVTITNANRSQFVDQDGIVRNRNFKNHSYSVQSGDAVVVTASEPVRFENCAVWPIRDGFHPIGNQHKVQVHNCKGWAYETIPDDRGRGKFVFSENGGYQIHVTRCYAHGFRDFAYAWNITPYAQSNTQHCVKIEYNRAENLYGKEVANPTARAGHFFQPKDIFGGHGMSCRFNEVIGVLGVSKVEDVINLYRTRGLPESWIHIEHNLFRNYNQNPLNNAGTGSGMALCDRGTTIEDYSGFLNCRNNWVLECGGYGIGLERGHDVNVHDNKIISSGIAPTGELILWQNVGLRIRNDAFHEGTEPPQGPYIFFNISFRRNEIAYMSNSPNNNNGNRARNDRHFPGFDEFIEDDTYAARGLEKQPDSEGVLFPGVDIQPAHVEQVYQRYLEAKATAGYVVGANW